jgi:glycosyltransferase involved in cell wall biosynthesis
MIRTFDVVHSGDPRFRGGSSSALAVELEAAQRTGLSCALLPVLGGTPWQGHGFHPRIRAVLQAGHVHLLAPDEPAETDVLFAHHPAVFQHAPQTPVRLRAKRIVCVVHHPVRMPGGQVQYDVEGVRTVLERTFDGPVLFAPVSPLIRRQLLAHGVRDSALTNFDLSNLVDLQEWAVRDRSPPGAVARLGRHSRPDRLKWPDDPAEIRAAFPLGRDYRIRILGGPPPANVLPMLPANWEVLAFDVERVPQFLAELDFYVYHHSREWTEAFGIAIAEAMAAGLVVIVDPYFEELFGPGAVYGYPSEVVSIVERFRADPALYLAQSKAAAVVAERFSLAAFPSRIARLWQEMALPTPDAIGGGDVETGRPSAEAGRPSKHRRQARRRFLFISINGVGLGHLTRQLAIARRLPPDVEAAFLTSSKGADLVAKFGYPVDFLPWHADVAEDRWNGAYSLEVANALELFAPDGVLFDGNLPYPGLLDVMSNRPDILWFWVRRGMWIAQSLPPDAKQAFDLVFTPGEWAEHEDLGPTRGSENAVAVAPILLLDPDERTNRNEAMAALGFPSGKLNVVVQLESRNFDYRPIRARLFKLLRARSDVQVIEVRSPIAAPEADPAAFDSIPQRSIYPLSRFSRAIDLLITGAGYNSYHESIFGGVPTIFVPNEAPRMDDQLLRARYAQTMQMGLCLRAHRSQDAAPSLEQALSPEFRSEVHRRTPRRPLTNGSMQVAQIIEEALFSVRTYPALRDRLPRI